jgi:hypothetical protein
MASDLPQLKGRTVTLWLCLDAGAKCGLWYSDKAQAAKNRENWAAIVPVELPASVYTGLRDHGDRAEAPPVRGESRDVSADQPATRNAPAVILEPDLEDWDDVRTDDD